MDFQHIQIITIALLFFIALGAGLVPYFLKQQHRHHLMAGEQFASGLFLSIGLFHLAVDAIEHIPGDSSKLFVIVIIICMIALFSLLDFTLTHLKNVRMIPYSFGLMLFTHSLFEGAAIGIENTVEHTLVLGGAVLLHKGPEAFAYALVLQAAEVREKIAKTLIALFALMSPIGVLLALHISDSLSHSHVLHYEGYIDAILAGAFICYGLEGLLELYQDDSHEKTKNGIAFVMGFLLMLGLISLTGA